VQAVTNDVPHDAARRTGSIEKSGTGLRYSTGLATVAPSSSSVRSRGAARGARVQTHRRGQSGPEEEEP